MEELLLFFESISLPFVLIQRGAGAETLYISIQIKIYFLGELFALLLVTDTWRVVRNKKCGDWEKNKNKDKIVLMKGKWYEN
ncbi:hypothetical protein COE15_06780 [Bacillus cereus]|uniref:hypothetical protein n=1 Tax=Bacillus sp. AFS023182 TaxID=2033492 RepID=UPI000BF333A0|nr:hypothetical protein [Bacillus sp. AFS023182]PFE05059.1 hypothetical protein CN288_05360 [Bacillus sp. AFS023182]PGY02983.1 hypothetical protein COE15_06780 [Bacillus cereus]